MAKRIRVDFSWVSFDCDGVWQDIWNAETLKKTADELDKKISPSGESWLVSTDSDKHTAIYEVSDDFDTVSVIAHDYRLGIEVLTDSKED